MRPPTRIARQGMVLNDTALTPYHARAAPAKAALGQFATPYFVASGSASPQRTPTYASGCRPARASSGSQLAPVPAPKLTHDHSCLVARRGLRVWQRMRASESA